MSLTNLLFKASRLSADGRAVRRGRVGPRIANRIKGRALARVGFWKALFGGWRR